MPLACGVIAPPGTKLSLASRFDLLQTGVEALLTQLNLMPGDILICEGPAPLVLIKDTPASAVPPTPLFLVTIEKEEDGKRSEVKVEEREMILDQAKTAKP